MSPPRTPQQSLLVAAYLSLATMGTNSTMTGALLPVIVRTLDLDAAQAGLLASGPGVGYIVAVALAGLLSDSLGCRTIWLAGVGMGLLALFALALAPSFLWLLPAIAALGLVGGFFDGGINPLMSALTEGRAGGVLNRVHAFFGVGATTGPLLVSIGVRMGLPWRWHYVLLAAYLLLVGALVTRNPLIPASRPPAVAGTSLISALRRRPVLLGALAMLLYGGVEACLFSWTALYFVQTRGFTPSVGSLAVSLFGAALLTGRFASSAVVERLGYGRLVIGGALLGSAGVGLMIWSPGRLLPWVGIALAGLAWSGIFATIVADVAAQAPGRAGAVAGLVCASSGVGKIILPWWVGQVAQRSSITTGLSLAVVGSILLGVSYALSRK